MNPVIPANFANRMPSSISSLPTTNSFNGYLIGGNNLEKLDHAKWYLKEARNKTWVEIKPKSFLLKAAERVKEIFFTAKEITLNNSLRNKRESSLEFKEIDSSSFEEVVNGIDIKDERDTDFLGKIPGGQRFDFLMHLKGQLKTNQDWKYLAKAFKFLSHFYNEDNDELKYDQELIDNIHNIFQLFENTTIKNAFQFSVFESLLEMSGMGFITSPAKANIYLERLNDILNISSDSEMYSDIFSVSRILFKFEFLEKYSLKEFQKVQAALTKVVRSSFTIFESYNYEEHNQGFSSVCTFMQDALNAYGKLIQIKSSKENCIKILKEEMGIFFKNTKLENKEIKVIKHLIYFSIKDQISLEIGGRTFPFGFWEKVVFQDIYPYRRDVFLADKAVGFMGVNVFSEVPIEEKLQQQISREFKSAFNKMGVKPSDAFNIFIAKDLVSYSIYNEQFLEKPADYFLMVHPGYYYEDTDIFTLSESLAKFLRVPKQSLSMAIYSKDNVLLDLERKCEKVLTHIITLPTTQSTTSTFTLDTSTAFPTQYRTTKNQTPIIEDLSTNTPTDKTTFITQVSTTKDIISNIEDVATFTEQAVFTTPVEEVSTMFATEAFVKDITSVSITQGTITEDVTSMSESSTTEFTTPVEEVSTMFTTEAFVKDITSVSITQSTITEDVTSTSESSTTEFTTPVEEVSTIFTTQEAVVKDITSVSITQGTITEDVTSTSESATTDIDLTEHVTVMPIPQKPILKYVATLAGIVSGLVLFIGLYFFRRKKGSYNTQEDNPLVSRFDTLHPSFRDEENQV